MHSSSFELVFVDVSGRLVEFMMVWGSVDLLCSNFRIVTSLDEDNHPDPSRGNLNSEASYILQIQPRIM